MEYSNEKLLLSLRAQDIQTGLQDYKVDHFETLLQIGMAARLAIHIRGRDAIEYDLLKELAAILFGVPKLAFSNIIKVLDDVEFVRVVGDKSPGMKVLPQVPYFDNLYEKLSEKAKAQGLNELEKISVEILNRLALGPISKRKIIKELNLDKTTADLVLQTGKAGSYIDSFKRSDGDEILISPVYFSERPEELKKAIEKYGTESTFTVFEAVRAYPGWPLSAIVKNMAIGDIKLHPEQVKVVQELARKGVLQPPAVTTVRSGTNYFLFTPPIGNERIRVVEKEVYEMAMAIISAARQGQHFARYPIRSPRAVINALLRDGWLRATTEAKEQWRAVALLRICKLIPKGDNFYEVHLIPMEENIKAVRLALQLLDVGDVKEERGLDPEVRLMLDGGDMYQETLRSLGTVRQKLIIPSSESHITTMLDNILEQLQKG